MRGVVYSEAMPFLFSILVVMLMIGALIDIITRDSSQVRYLPKPVWLILVILLPLIGSALWFGLGREYGDAGIRMPRMERAPREPRTAGPTVAPPAPVDVRTTEQQIADLDREIEEWRLREEIAKRKRERGEQVD